MQERIVLIAVAAGRGAHAAASAGTDVILILLEVVGWVRREGGFALRGEGGVGDGVGEGSGATEVHHVAEGHPGGDGEEDAVLVVSFIQSTSVSRSKKEFTYKMKTPIMVVASLSLHLAELPYAQLSHPVLELLSSALLVVDLESELDLSSELLEPLDFPWAT